MAGLGCGLGLGGLDHVILEAADGPGGLARSSIERGFTFDRAGHWLHLRYPRAESLISRVARLDPIERRSMIRFRGRHVPYPFQGNLHALPAKVAARCLLGFVLARDRRMLGEPEPEDFEGFVRYHLGDGIADEFMLPYNQKLWDVDLGTLSARWCGRFVPRPTLEDVIEGALGVHGQAMGYNATLLHPGAGGIQVLAEALAGLLPRRPVYGAEVVSVDLDERVVTTAQGEQYGYQALVSTMPLPDLVAMCTPVPPEVRAAAATLSATTIHVVNLGVAVDSAPLGGAHWVYLPDPDMAPFRVGVYSNVSPDMAPEAAAGFYLETSSGPGRSRPAPTVEEAMGVLEAIDAVPPGAEVLASEVLTLDRAYVVFDSAHGEAVELIGRHLASAGIYSIGRYGRWTYCSMEDALVDGLDTARAIAEELQ